MTTIRDIATGSYRLIGVVADDEAMTADQADAGLSAFNEMASAWVLENIPAISADLTLDSTFPFHDMFREGTRFMLASRLSHQYKAPPTFDAESFLEKVRKYYLIVDPVAFDPMLTRRGSTLRNRTF